MGVSASVDNCCFQNVSSQSRGMTC
jgi:hypothetical protein